MDSDKKKWHHYLVNKYTIVGTVFIIYTIFFDQNSYLMHKELNREIEQLKEDIIYYENQLKKQQEELKSLKNNRDYYERVAREKYFMKRPNEDVFIIKRKDSIPSSDE